MRIVIFFLILMVFHPVVGQGQTSSAELGNEVPTTTFKVPQVKESGNPYTYPLLRRPYLHLGYNQIRLTGQLARTSNEKPTDTNSAQYEFSHTAHQKLSRNTYLIWHVVPAGLGHIFEDGPAERVAAEWTLEPEYRNGLFQLSPTFSGKRKWTWTGRFGAETVLQYAYVIPFAPDAFSYWRADLNAAVIFQTTEDLALSLFAQPILSNVSLAKIYANEPDPKRGETIKHIGLGPRIQYTMGQHLTLEARAWGLVTEFSEPAYFGQLDLNVLF